MPQDNVPEVVPVPAVVPVPDASGSPAPSPAPDAGAAVVEPVVAEPSVVVPEPEASSENPLEVMRSQADTRYRTLQSTKDQEIAALQAQLNASQVPQPVVPEPDAGKDFNGRAFLDMIEAGNENDAFDKMLKMAETRAVAQVTEQQRSRDYETQFMADFDSATTGYTEEEQQATVNIIQTHVSQGRPITPQHAAAMARFGTLDKALEYANSYAASVATPTGAAPVAPNGQPAAPAPVAQHHPPVMGLGGPKFQFGQSDDAAGANPLEGLYDKLQ